MKHSLRQLRRYPLQSLFIILTIGLGAGVVTALYSIVTEPVNQDQLWQREVTLQDTQLVPRRTGIALREVRGSDNTPVSFQEADLAIIKEAVPSLEQAYAFTRWQLPVSKADRSFRTDVSPITREYPSAAGIQLREGSALSDSDFTERRSVIVLSAELAEQLEATVGEKVAIEGADTQQNEFTVIGILAPALEQSSLIPYGSIQGLDDDLKSLNFSVANKELLPAALDELSTFARRTWGDRVTATIPPADDGSSRIIFLVIFAFASTALLAASFNIMNLMLARVFKSTRDIGVKRALGATQGNIIRQFLGEALFLGFLGGVLGVFIGFGFSWIYASIIGSYAADVEASGAFAWSAALLSLLISLLATLIFGLYPSIRAAKLKVVDALETA